MGVQYRFDCRIIVAMTDGIRDTALPNDIEALKVLIAVRDATIERLTRHAELLQEQPGRPPMPASPIAWSFGSARSARS